MGKSLLQCLFIKKLLFAALLLGIVTEGAYSQSTLSPGDIAVVTVNADGDKNFDFVPLVDLESGTEIKFTDAPFIESEGALDDSEGTLIYTAPTNISAGEVVSYNGVDDNGTNGFVRSGHFDPASSGDNLIVYQGDAGNSPTFLYGIGWARGDSWDHAGGTNSSDIPTGLSEENNQIVNLGTAPNYQYNTASGLEGTASYLLSLIADESNWIEDSNSSFPEFSSSFTLINPPTIAFTASSINYSEDSGIAEIAVELVEADGAAVSVDVVLLSNSSTATNGEDFTNYTTQTITFSRNDPDGATQTVSLDITDDSDFESSESAVFQLQNNTRGNIIAPRVLTLSIEDNDTPDIVINEIHADPDDSEGDADGSGVADGRDDEFVEFVNNGSSDIDISGWTFSDESDLRHTFPEGTVISANGSLVLFADDNVNPQGNFGGAVVQSSNVSASLSLNNSGDVITLADADGNTVVSVDYSDAANHQSIVRDPEITGDFKPHSEVAGAGGSLFSPGTKVDGTPFGSDHAIAFRGSEGWRMVSSPVQNATFNDLFGDLWMQGIAGSEDPEGGLTLALWLEQDTTFTAPAAMSETMTPGKGYIVYVFEDDDNNAPGIQGGFPKIITTEKNENSNIVNVTVSATDANEDGLIDGNEGWNLLGNPFASDLSVEALISELEKVDPNVNANIYVWDHDGGDGNGRYVDLSEGDRIAPFQAFFVRFPNEVNETDFQFNKVNLEANTGAPFFKSKINDVLTFDLELHGEQYFDTYSLKFSENGSVDLDRFDAYKLFSLNRESISLYSKHGDNRLQKNALPRELESTLEIPLFFDANGRSSLAFRWKNKFESFPSEWILTLIDKVTNREIDLRRDNEYTFTVIEAGEKEMATASDKKGLLNKENHGQNSQDNRFILSITPGEQEREIADIPNSVKLNPNYPNPFNPSTTIPYELTEDAEVKLTIWNMIGQKVATLVDGLVEAGEHEETWNASNMPSGMYIARFEVSGQVFTRKMTLIK